MTLPPRTLGERPGDPLERAPAAPEPPFPFEPVRDLLGVVRSMYAAALEAGAGRNDLGRIARVGQELGRALDLAGSSRQGADAQAAAWRQVEAAMLEVAALVDPLTPAAPIVSAARRLLAPTREPAPILRGTAQKKHAPR